MNDPPKQDGERHTRRVDDDGGQAPPFRGELPSAREALAIDSAAHALLIRQHLLSGGI
jgi:hypothetical protein